MNDKFTEKCSKLKIVLFSAVLIAGSLKDSTIAGIKLRSPELKDVIISSGKENVINVNINNKEI